MSATPRGIAWLTRRVAVVLCALALFPPPGGIARAAPGSAHSADTSKQKALQSAIESAFRSCDASPMNGSFSPRLKTLLASRALGVRQGYYGADQVLLILKRSFEGRTTLRFSLTAPEDAERREARHVIPAVWRFRDESGSKSEARLSFTLAPEAGSWYIREIRETK